MHPRSNRTWISLIRLGIGICLAIGAGACSKAPAAPPPASQATPAESVPTSRASPAAPIPEPTSLPQPTPTTEPPTAAPPDPVVGSQTYDVRHSLTFKNRGSGKATRIEVSVALIQDRPPNQRVLALEADQPYHSVTDEDGNTFAVFTIWEVAPGAIIEINIDYKVVVNALAYDLSRCAGELIDEATQAEAYIESDAPRIIALAGELSANQPDVCAQARSFYDYVGDTLKYAGYNPDNLGALGVLDARRGDCSEYADLLIALARSQKIPARFLEGVTCCTDGGYNEGETKHDWTEIYLPGIGWVPADATYGRAAGDRETYFARMPSDRIIVTTGRSPALLEGYGYWIYYWWGSASVDFATDETWSVLRSAD